MKLVPNQVWQIICEVPVKAIAAGELLYSVLLQLGVQPSEIVEKIERHCSKVEVFAAHQDQAKKIVTQLKRLGLRSVKISLSKVKKTDWQDLWKKDIKPFSLTDHIEIIPRWVKSAKANQHSRKFPVYIDTNMAFGTGLHETTRFMAQLIEHCAGEFDSFLDIGTGSGILAIIAHHYGAKEITALDIDRQSIAVAKENFAANHVVGIKIFAKDFAQWKSRRTYDFVAANLVTHDLIQFAKGLRTKVKMGQYLAVSGISLENLPALKKVFAKLSFKVIKTLRGQLWSAVLYQRGG